MISFIYTLFNRWRIAPAQIPTPRTGDPTLPIDSNISPSPSTQISRVIVNSDSSLPQLGLPLMPFTQGVEESTPPTPPIPPTRLISISRDSESNPVPPLPPLPISRESNESDD
jgi:hypothetical protein